MRFKDKKCRQKQGRDSATKFLVTSINGKDDWTLSVQERRNLKILIIIRWIVSKHKTWILHHSSHYDRSQLLASVVSAVSAG